MIFSENRFPLFGIMLWRHRAARQGRPRPDFCNGIKPAGPKIDPVL